MHFDGIQEDTFKRARTTVIDSGDRCIFFSTELFKSMPDGWDALFFGRALLILVEFSLITLDDERRISMHPLVHEWSRERMSPAEQKTAWEYALSTLAITYTPDTGLINHRYKRSLFPHIRICLHSPEAQLHLFTQDSEIYERLQIVSAFSAIYNEAFQWQEMLDLETRALECKKKLYDDEEEATIMKSIKNIAVCFQNLCRYKESEELCRFLVDVAKKKTGADSSWTYVATMQLAEVHEDMGNYQIGLDLVERIVGVYERMFGKEDVTTLNVKVTMGRFLYRLQRFKEAARLQEEIYAICQKRYSETDHVYMRARESLALTYEEMGIKGKKKGEKLREANIILLKSILGEDHHNTLIVLSNGICGKSWAEGRKGIEVQVEMFQKIKERFGLKHPTTLGVMENLSRGYFYRGDLESAKAIQETVVKETINICGETHPRTVKATKYLRLIERGMMLRKIGYWWVPDRLIERFCIPESFVKKRILNPEF